jgi:hypothetical protein
MKKLAVAFIAVFSLLIASLSFAGEGLKVEAAAIATGVEGLSPTGVAETFPGGTELLYCYSKITGAESGDKIEHRWYWGDELVATVELPLKSSSWRTYSTKRIIRPWHGKWRVDIVSNNAVLQTLGFTVESPYPASGKATEEKKQ